MEEKEDYIIFRAWKDEEYWERYYRNQEIK